MQSLFSNNLGSSSLNSSLNLKSRLAKGSSNSIEIKGKVLISELSGSESLIHFRNSNMNWVSLSNGTHQMNVGQDAKLYMNVDEFMYFDKNNKLVSNV